jgi:PKD repeat protein
MLTSSVNAGCSSCESEEKQELQAQVQAPCQDCDTGGIMPMSPEDIEEWNRMVTEGPFREIESTVSIDSPGYKTLIDHILYDPVERNQGSCGNCWVWAGTGVMEIALSVQDNILARLSIQNFSSCYNGGANASWVCCGGNLGAFTSRYNNVGYVIPWNNTNADWYNDGIDRFKGCYSGPTSVPCNTIDTSCNYTITSIQTINLGIETVGIPHQTAISNIKSVLDSNKGIYFGFQQGNWSADGAFYDEWGDYGEDHIWDINATCSQTWSPPASGGHGVVCLGYNDTDPDPLKHYWIMLNSWGTTGQRPNGIFLVPMHMDYNCTINNPDGEDVRAFWFGTFDITYSVDLPVADADGSYIGDEGSPVQLNGSLSSDPDGSIQAYNWDTNNDGIFDDASGETPFYTWGDDYSGPVTLQVTDDDCLNDTDSTTATIDNVVPDVDAGEDQTADEGDLLNFNGSFTDPGWLDTHNATWTWGDGTAPAKAPGTATLVEENNQPDSTGNVLANHTYCDNDVYTVTLNVTDDDDGWKTDTLTVTVNNVAPTVDAGPDQTVNEGDVVVFDGNFTDPGSCDTHTIEWDFGDGNTASGNLTPTHAYCDNGTYTVTLNVTDDDGDWDTDTLTVTVNNVAPYVEAGPDQTVDEGDLVNFKGNFTDPGWCDNHTAIWDYGDGSPPEPGVLVEENLEPDATGNVTGNHTYCDNGNYTVTLNVTDDDGGLGSDTLKVTLNNVPPNITMVEMTYFHTDCVSVDVEFYAEFTDPGWCDTHTAVWCWGDGSSSSGAITEENLEPDATGTVTGKHTYPLARFNHYVVKLYLIDDDGGEDVYTYRYVQGPVGGELLPNNALNILYSSIVIISTITASTILIKKRKN